MTVHVASSSATAVIVVTPAPTPVTRPLLSTVAIELLADFHVTESVASMPLYLALICTVNPFFTVAVVGVKTSFFRLVTLNFTLIAVPVYPLFGKAVATAKYVPSSVGVPTKVIGSLSVTCSKSTRYALVGTVFPPTVSVGAKVVGSTVNAPFDISISEAPDDIVNGKLETMLVLLGSLKFFAVATYVPGSVGKDEPTYSSPFSICLKNESSYCDAGTVFPLVSFTVTVFAVGSTVNEAKEPSPITKSLLVTLPV